MKPITFITALIVIATMTIGSTANAQFFKPDYTTKLVLAGSGGPELPKTLSLLAPAGIGASFSLTLPATVGTVGYMLTTDGATGQLSWTNPATGITLAGDVIGAAGTNTIAHTAQAGNNIVGALNSPATSKSMNADVLNYDATLQVTGHAIGFDLTHSNTWTALQAFNAKATSASTVSGDGGTTLTTKDYVDNSTNTSVSGTVNTMAKFTGAHAVGNSSVTDDGATFGINVDKFTVDEASGNTTIGTFVESETALLITPTGSNSGLAVYNTDHVGTSFPVGIQSHTTGLTWGTSSGNTQGRMLRLYDEAFATGYDFGIGQTGSLFIHSTDGTNLLTITGAGNLAVTGKGTSASTLAGDGGTTLTTKDYVDASNASIHAGNGLTRNGNEIDLGGTALAGNTDIPLAGHNLTFSGSGNVGIGTTSPSNLLNIVKNQNAGTVLEIDNSSAGASAYTTLLENNGTNNASFGMNSTGSSFLGPNHAFIWTDGDGIALRSSNASGDIIMSTGGDAASNIRMKITSSGNVGIGTTTPAQALDVNGRARIENLPVNTDDNLVTANANGDLSVRSALSLVTSNAWSLTGNAGTAPGGVNFLGTTDNNDVVFKTNSIEQLRLRSTGGVNIPATTSAGVGAIYQNGAPFIHSYGSTYNFFAGTNAGNFTMTGVLNTGVGTLALLHLTTGGNNVAFGRGTGQALTSGSFNSAMGDAALNANQAGGYNAAFGSQAMLFYNSTAAIANNSAFGTNAMQQSLDGIRNTAIGGSALLNTSGNAAGTNGSNNTGVGYQAGKTNTTGQNNTYLGSNADADVSSPALSNATAIGANASVTASNSIQLGDANITLVNTSGALQFAGTLKPGGSQGTTGQILQSNGGSTPTWVNLSTLGVSSILGTLNQVQVNGSYTIPANGPVQLALPQDIATTSDVNFHGVRVNGLSTGVAHSSSNGTLSSSLIVDGDITPGTISDGSLATPTFQVVSSDASLNVPVGSSQIGSTQNVSINTGHDNNWTGKQTVTGANKFAYVDGNQTAGYVLTEDVSGNAAWKDPATVGVTSATGTAPIQIDGDNASHNGNITVSIQHSNLLVSGTGLSVSNGTGAVVGTSNATVTLTTGNLTTTGALGVTGGTNTLVGSSSAISLTTDASLNQTGGTLNINTANPNAWSGTQTFGGTVQTVATGAALAGNTDNYALGTGNTAYTISSPTASIVSLSGMTGGVSGRVVTIQNTGTGYIELLNQTGSSAGNQFSLAGGDPVYMGPGATVNFLYIGTYWTIVSGY